MKTTLAILLVLLVHARAQTFDHLSGSGRDPQIDKLTFSNTAKWEAAYLIWLKKKPAFLPGDWQRAIILPQPPDNSSDRARAEITALTDQVKLRPEHREKILAELDIKNFKVGNLTYKQLTRGEKYPRTGELLDNSYQSIATAIFIMKKKFNRPRPSVIASKIGLKLQPSIQNPGHPAYPSGHATEAFAIAFILRELDPGNSEVYLRDAAGIAKNREIAGVHYASDSTAGRLLARQLVDAFLRDPRFQNQLERARREWPDQPGKK